MARGPVDAGVRRVAEMASPSDPRLRPVQVGPFGAAEAHSTAADWIEQVRRAEAEGCSTVLVGDHCVSTPACTARLAMAAAVTTTQDAAASGALG
jgi:alkanesulfonate monooxygenase SsuD/methylene tetrahydromethanopterin reductase-like flavin-dependent oxidoreductase (luciferase family)